MKYPINLLYIIYNYKIIQTYIKSHYTKFIPKHMKAASLLTLCFLTLLIQNTLSADYKFYSLSQ